MLGRGHDAQRCLLLKPRAQGMQLPSCATMQYHEVPCSTFLVALQYPNSGLCPSTQTCRQCRQAGRQAGRQASQQASETGITTWHNRRVGRLGGGPRRANKGWGPAARASAHPGYSSGSSITAGREVDSRKSSSRINRAVVGTHGEAHLVCRVDAEGEVALSLHLLTGKHIGGSRRSIGTRHSDRMPRQTASQSGI